MSFESFEQKTGVERVYETSKQEALERLRKSYKEEVVTTAQKILDDENFKTEATRSWEKDLANTDDPEEKEGELAKGLYLQLKDKLEKEGAI